MGLERGYVHVYTGNGKGKTSAALGLGLRAAGAGLRVCMVQFIKGVRSSEVGSLAYIPNFVFVPYEKFVADYSKGNAEAAGKCLEYSREIVGSGSYDVVILDEINVAVGFGLVSLEEVLNLILIKNKPKNLELVLTGRYAAKELVDLADIVTEMREVKHVFKKGVQARRGIDY